MEDGARMAYAGFFGIRLGDVVLYIPLAQQREED